MKVVILFVAVCAFYSAASAKVSLEQWQSFKTEFGKEYEDPVEDLQRLQIYLENKQKIEEHNKLFAEGKATYEMGVNEFTDWTFEEFSQKMLMPADSLEKMYNDTEFFETFNGIENLDLAPSAVDWRSKDAVTGVKSQGQCGSCWAFAAVGTIEGQWKIKKGKLVSLSEQNLVDCDKQSHGCQGGRSDAAMDWVAHHGINSEQTYPYKAQQGSCNFNPKQIAASIQGVAKVKSKDENALQEAVANVGPVVVYIGVESSFHSYKSGIYSTKCTKDEINHAVLVVGYDLTSKYYIVKNSWGTGWGENGYIRMAIGSNLCNIATYGLYAVV